VDKDEIDAMLAAHRRQAWIAGAVCGFAWAALGAIAAAAVLSHYVIVTDKPPTKVEKKK
jgi:hypothetical protein